MDFKIKKKFVNENELTMQVLKERKLNVAAYIRVSTEHDDQRLSIDSQRKHYLEKIQNNDNWNLIDIFEDNGKSGTSVNKRKGFQEMMKTVSKGKIDLILTKSLSRFARNTVDTIKYVRLLKEKNIGIYFEEENINTLDMNGELMITILSSIAQQESINLSSHVKQAFKMMSLKGIPLGMVKCFGYNYDSETKQLSINEEEAEVIRYIAKLYLEGNGTCKIAKILTEKNIKGIGGKTSWREETVTRILKNEKIKGDLVIGRYYKNNPLDKQTIRNKGEKEMYYIHDHHDAIISKKMWQEINDEMKRRSEARNHKNEWTCTNRFSMSGKLKCGFCKNSLNRLLTNSYKDAKQYCSSNKTGNSNNCLESKMINEEILQKAFMQSMSRLRNKIKLNATFSSYVFEKIIYARKILLNRDDLDIDKYEDVLFTKLVSYAVLGGYDENDKIQPYMFRIVIKSYDDEIYDSSTEYNDKDFNDNLKLLDFYSNQTFYCFEKDKNGRSRQRFVNRIRVQVFVSSED